MYSNSPSIPTPASFAQTPIQFADTSTTAQQQKQQQLRYSLLNFNVSATAGLISPTPVLVSSSNISRNGIQSSTQSSS
ncbi:unnamed protein product, partial [Rotaria sp. Silwood1]